jgi:hypothetical protein
VCERAGLEETNFAGKITTLCVINYGVCKRTGCYDIFQAFSNLSTYNDTHMKPIILLTTKGIIRNVNYFCKRHIYIYSTSGKYNGGHETKCLLLSYA